MLEDIPGRSINPASGAPLTPERRAALRKSKLPWQASIYVYAAILPIGFQLGPLAMTSLRLVLLIMVIPLLINLLAKRYGPILPTDYLFIAHIFWAIIALAYNNPDKVIEQAGSVGLEFLGGYLIGRAYVRTPEAFLALSRRLVFIILLMLPFTLYETLTGHPIIVETIRKVPGLSSVTISNADKRMGLERVQLTFAHPIHFGLFCSVALSMSFVALRGISGTIWRYLSSMVVAGSGFLALSSGALLAIFLQFGLFAWSWIFAPVKQRWWILFGLFVLFYIGVDLFSNRSPIKVLMTYATFSSHTAYWRGIIFEWGMVNVWANPIFGIGLNDWVRPRFMVSGSMDNFWLVMGVRYGIPGFLLLAVGYALATAQVMRRNFDADSVVLHIRRGWVFTILGLSFTLCTVHIWSSIYSYVFFTFGSGMWLITYQPPASGEAAPTPRVGAGPSLRPPQSGAIPRPAGLASGGYTRFPPVQPMRRRTP